MSRDSLITSPHKVDLVIWRGIDYVLPIGLQNKYKTEVGHDLLDQNYPFIPSNLSEPNNVIDMFDVIILDNISSFKFEVFPILTAFDATDIQPIHSFSCDEILKFSEENNFGFDGNFNVIRHQYNQFGSITSNDFVTMHIPYNITETFTFLEADYRIVLVDETNDIKYHHLMYGHITMFGEKL
jgi:hypothetical protein